MPHQDLKQQHHSFMTAQAPTPPPQQTIQSACQAFCAAPVQCYPYVVICLVRATEAQTAVLHLAAPR